MYSCPVERIFDGIWRRCLCGSPRDPKASPVAGPSQLESSIRLATTVWNFPQRYRKQSHTAPSDDDCIGCADWAQSKAPHVAIIYWLGNKPTSSNEEAGSTGVNLQYKWTQAPVERYDNTIDLLTVCSLTNISIDH